jgi:hypothetical protein
VLINPENLMRSVYKNAGIDPKDTGYIEAHGTGTKVGDPIEVAALQRVFGEDRTARNPLFIGSVKSNLGHLEAASGETAFEVSSSQSLIGSYRYHCSDKSGHDARTSLHIATARFQEAKYQDSLFQVEPKGAFKFDCCESNELTNLI